MKSFDRLRHLIKEGIQQVLIEREKQVSFKGLSGTAQDDILRYLTSIGKDYEDYQYYSGVMTAEGDKKYWYENKAKMEGPPPDTDLINQICSDGEIKEPVILDVSAEYTVEGRHRLAAALQCDLDVPVITMV